MVAIFFCAFAPLLEPDQTRMVAARSVSPPSAAVIVVEGETRGIGGRCMRPGPLMLFGGVGIAAGGRIEGRLDRLSGGDREALLRLLDELRKRKRPAERDE
jgi:hypothetical protein